MSNQQNEIFLQHQEEIREDIDVFDADQCLTDEGKKKRQATTILDCQFKEDNPNFDKVNEYLEDTMAFISHCLPKKS
jgi:hypothetical protein